MKTKIDLGTQRLVYNISIMIYFIVDIIIAFWFKSQKPGTKDYSWKTLRAILKMTSKRDPLVINMFIDIFLAILKENGFPLVELCRTRALISPLCYLYVVVSFGRAGFQSCTLIFFSMHLLLNTGILKSNSFLLVH